MVVNAWRIVLQSLPPVVAPLFGGQRGKLVPRGNVRLKVEVCTATGVGNVPAVHAFPQRVVLTAPAEESIRVPRKMALHEAMYATKILRAVVIPRKACPEMHNWARPRLRVHTQQGVVRDQVDVVQYHSTCSVVPCLTVSGVQQRTAVERQVVALLDHNNGMVLKACKCAA